MNILLIVAVIVVVGVGALYLFVPKARTWIRANWKTVAEVIGGLFAGAAIEGTYQMLEQAVRGVVVAGQPFKIADDTHVLVQTPDGAWKMVPLPPGVSSASVSSIAITTGKPPVVEVNNAPIDKT